MTDIGRIALIIAFTLAMYAAISSIAGTRSGCGRLVRSARGSILAVFGLFTLALALILYAFFTKDFNLTIVAEHASRDLPVIYTLSALYADKAGSMFFWGWLISLFTFLLVFPKRNSSQVFMPYAIAILAIIEAFYISLVTFLTNIFAQQPSPTVDGFGLNPLLQNFGMLVHPPLLYLGFAGFAVVFVLVMAAFITRRPEVWQNNLIRRWSLFAWGTLGIGNIVGMWWSYNELGWGGYWAWDPVENAGLMPWLLSTAFLHSMAMCRQRKCLQTWSFCLIIFTFVFTLLSPFITHGGIESPLHGFYGSPFPPYILAAMMMITISSLWLLFARRRYLEREVRPPSFISREGSFLLTNIIMVVLVFIILTGTVLPRVVEALGGGKIVLDRSFFDRTGGPIMLLLVLLMGVCPLLGWGRTIWNSSRRNILYFLAALVFVAAAILVSGVGNWYIAVVVLCGLPLFIISREWYRGTRARHRSQGENYLQAFFSLINGNRARYGGFLAHSGIVLMTLGIIVSSFYSMESTVTLNVGDSMRAGKYELTYSELIFKQDTVKASAVASITISKHGKTVGTMRPSYAYWFSHDDYFAEVAVRTTPAEDLFISLVWTGFDPADRSATFRVLVNPLIVWIWMGGAFFLIGGAVSFSFKEKQPYGGKE